MTPPPPSAAAAAEGSSRLGLQKQPQPQPQPQPQQLQLRGSIVVVAKCPIPGQCKTRLLPLLGAAGAATLARAMLSDILVTLSTRHPLLLQQQQQSVQVQKILLYAPLNENGQQMMQQILHETHLHEYPDNASPTDAAHSHAAAAAAAAASWILMPMLSGDNDDDDDDGSSNDDDNDDWQSSDLGAKLASALRRVRQIAKQQQQQPEQHQPPGPVVFLGMDAPELPLDEICAALLVSSPESTSTAVLCPASDGGYGMLSVPPNVDDAHAHADVFADMLWSHPLTDLCQIKALTDAGVTSTRIGKLMHDVDEPDDVAALAQRLSSLSTSTEPQQQPKTSLCCLLDRPSAAAVAARTAMESDSTTTTSSSLSSSLSASSSCPYTKKVLKLLGQWPSSNSTNANHNTQSTLLYIIITIKYYYSYIRLYTKRTQCSCLGQIA